MGDVAACNFPRNRSVILTPKDQRRREEKEKRATNRSPARSRALCPPRVESWNLKIMRRCQKRERYTPKKPKKRKKPRFERQGRTTKGCEERSPAAAPATRQRQAIIPPTLKSGGRRAYFFIVTSVRRLQILDATRIPGLCGGKKSQSIRI